VLGGVWWNQNLALGSIFYAGIVGLLLSFLVVPSTAQRTQE
jgi:quinol-cytochrome oxidoreductase complex cytochrome b subunit